MTQTEVKKTIIERLENLSDSEFLKLFRHFLDEKQYDYPNSQILKDRYNAILVLLADVQHRKLMDALQK